MPREPASRQPIQENMMFVTSAFNPRIPDLDPIAFDAAIPSEGIGGVFPA
jgi:hypothetical protein